MLLWMGLNVTGGLSVVTGSLNAFKCCYNVVTGSLNAFKCCYNVVTGSLSVLARVFHATRLTNLSGIFMRYVPHHAIMLIPINVGLFQTEHLLENLPLQKCKEGTQNKW